MEKQDAVRLAKVLRSFGSRAEGYQLKQLIAKPRLSAFHRWADDRPCCGAFLWERSGAEALWLVLVDWKKSGNFYLVLFAENRNGPLAEIHLVERPKDGVVLNWTYAPRKRDPRNKARIKYFVQLYGSDRAELLLPRTAAQAADFLDDVFALARIKEKAHSLHPKAPEPRDGFPEGRLVERRHLSRERDSAAAKAAKMAALQKYGRLRCECCDFDFFQVYGSHGKDFIEAHHTCPISTADEEGTVTRVEDLALVCSNCHSMLHRRRPWLTRNRLRGLVRRKQTGARTSGSPKGALP